MRTAKATIVVMRGGRGWWPWLAALGVTALMLVLIMVTFAPLSGKDGLQNAANRAQLTGGLLIAAAVPTVAVLGWARRRSRELRTAAAPTTDTLTRAKDVLAGLVAQQWRDEARLRSLGDPDPIPVRWRTPAPNSRTAAVMDHLTNIEPGDATDQGWTASSADIAALADRFRRLRRRRLVILGGPGMGKTTLAVQLLLHLLATRTRHPDEPVPVLLPVAGWDTEQYPRLQDWLADRLARDYPALRAPGLGVGVARALTGRGHILPVLDGLDELPSPAQVKVITALNRSLSGEDQLILTSRTPEFTTAVTTAGDVITSAAVLQPHLLDPVAAAGCLTRCLPPNPGPAWRRILTELRTMPPADPAAAGPAACGPGAALAEVAATPLGLWLLRTVYIAPGADPTTLTDPARFPTSAALRAHLFDQLIPAMIATRERRRTGIEPADDAGRRPLVLKTKRATRLLHASGGEPTQDVPAPRHSRARSTAAQVVEVRRYRPAASGTYAATATVPKGSRRGIRPARPGGGVRPAKTRRDVHQATAARSANRPRNTRVCGPAGPAAPAANSQRSPSGTPNSDRASSRLAWPPIAGDRKRRYTTLKTGICSSAGPIPANIDVPSAR